MAEMVYLDKMVLSESGTKFGDIRLNWELWHGEGELGALADWLNGCMAFGMHPQPFQGHTDDCDNYLGQPIVYDGTWVCEDGAMWFVGSDGASGGSGVEVRRKLLDGDRVIFY